MNSTYESSTNVWSLLIPSCVVLVVAKVPLKQTQISEQFDSPWVAALVNFIGVSLPQFCIDFQLGLQKKSCTLKTWSASFANQVRFTIV
ncbi:hypothetical protein HPP92_017269 [Vanilla planifolia]|uniref:PIN-like protein n=1 Tax=Vanilla planifolia TaxID=51239 RepID=A0A835QBX6_VANPL|nr:hypothetical protein HPP92_017269 [Vanilla planifolia]